MRYRFNDILNVIDRIRNTCILCYTLIIEINLTFCVYTAKSDRSLKVAAGIQYMIIARR